MATATRQRNVYPSDKIAHLWAHQTQSSARNACHNFYFEGDTIYSYGSHFPIARHVCHNGKRAIFLTTRGYSNTTSKHIHNVRYSIPPNVKTFHVVNVNGDASEALKAFRADVVSARESLDGAKSKPQRANRFRLLQSAISRANEFAKFFGFRVRYKLPANSEELDKLATEYSNTLDARREENDKKRAAKWAARSAESKALYEKQQREREQREREFDEKREALAEAWRNGEDSIPYDQAHKLPTMLRIVGENVETSLGVDFPLAHARRAVALLGGKLASGEAYQRNGLTVHLGHYSIDSLDESGTLRAGCHTVKREELERFIRELDALPV